MYTCLYIVACLSIIMLFIWVGLSVPHANTIFVSSVTASTCYKQVLGSVLPLYLYDPYIRNTSLILSVITLKHFMA